MDNYLRKVRGRLATNQTNWQRNRNRRRRRRNRNRNKGAIKLPTTAAQGHSAFQSNTAITARQPTQTQRVFPPPLQHYHDIVNNHGQPSTSYCTESQYEDDDDSESYDDDYDDDHDDDDEYYEESSNEGGAEYYDEEDDDYDSDEY